MQLRVYRITIPAALYVSIVTESEDEAVEAATRLQDTLNRDDAPMARVDLDRDDVDQWNLARDPDAIVWPALHGVPEIDHVEDLPEEAAS